MRHPSFPTENFFCAGKEGEEEGASAIFGNYFYGLKTLHETGLSKTKVVTLLAPTFCVEREK